MTPILVFLCEFWKKNSPAIFSTLANGYFWFFIIDHILYLHYFKKINEILWSFKSRFSNVLTIWKVKKAHVIERTKVIKKTLKIVFFNKILFIIYVKAKLKCSFFRWEYWPQKVAIWSRYIFHSQAPTLHSNLYIW